MRLTFNIKNKLTMLWGFHSWRPEKTCTVLCIHNCEQVGGLSYTGKRGGVWGTFTHRFFQIFHIEGETNE
jgi:hypothetical protein